MNSREIPRRDYGAPRKIDRHFYFSNVLLSADIWNFLAFVFLLFSI